MIRDTLGSAILMLAAAALAHAQAGRAPDLARLNSRAAATFKDSRCPGLSVAVAQDNKLIYSKAFGFADIEQKLPMKTDSAHRLASLSKPITGTILLDLVQSGRLKLDAPIKTYLPELPAAYDHVTLRQLLSHQAGVRDYRDLDEVFSMVRYPTSRDAIKAFVNDPLLFTPGAKTAYSTFGFTMAGAVAEAATGESFQSLSRDFFRRYRITGFDLDDTQTAVPKRVWAYSVDADGNVANTRAYDASNKYPAGGFTASAEDYLRFAIAVASGKVLRPEILQQAWTPQKNADGTTSSYGLGWGVSELDGLKMVGFNGLQPSSTTSFRYFPDEGVGAVALCNAEVVSARGELDLAPLLDDLTKMVLTAKQ